MENAGTKYNSSWTYIIVTTVVLVLIQVVFYMWDLFKKKNTKKDTNAAKNEAPLNVKEKSTAAQAPAIKSSKKKPSNTWKGKGTFTHPYLATNLMGHTKKVLGFDCTSDGKYLVSCAEDGPPDLGDSGGCGSSSGSEGGFTPPANVMLIDHSQGTQRPPRRRRKTRSRELPATPAPVAQPPAPVVVLHQNTLFDTGPLIRFKELNMTERDLVGCLSHYILRSDQLAFMGFPVESTTDPRRAVIFKSDFSRPVRKFDVNAREFIPGKKHIGSDGWSREEDSGRGSGSSSPRSGDSDPDSEEERNAPGIKRNCARCSKIFILSTSGEYLTRESCNHHWGRLYHSSWECCNAPAPAEGCVRAPLHVWSGTCAGLNGPLDGFVRTRRSGSAYRRRHIFAIDCEMCFTAAGLQVARVAVVGSDGCPVYGTYVTPESPVIDYNTRFSGIKPEHLVKGTKTLQQVQEDLLRLIDADSILVGHALENDLRALRLLHDRVVDTSAVYPHLRGPPFRRSLRALASHVLGQSVQVARHCPLEDARTSLDLMLFRVQKDFR